MSPSDRAPGATDTVPAVDGGANRPALPLDVFRCPLQGMQLIEASAGTGKTWAICGLVLRFLLEGGLGVDQLLVVTFTQAATAELRERVRSRIAQTLAHLRGQQPSVDPFVIDLLSTQRERGQSDEAMRLRLEAALQSFDEAAIFTIHGFCQRALSDAAFSAGVPLALDASSDSGTLELQVAQDFWRRVVAQPGLHPAVAAWLAEVGDSPERWREVLRKRLARPLAQLRWPDELEQRAGALDTTALQAAHTRARACWQAERGRIVAIVEEAAPRLHKTRYAPTARAEAAAAWDALLASDEAPWRGADTRRLDLFTARSLRPTGKQAPPDRHEFFALAETLLDHRAACAEACQAQRLLWLRTLLAEGPLALRQAQTAARVISFDGMLVQLHDRLQGPSGAVLAQRLRQRFPAVLIDEFQDTDPLQFAIFERLRGAGALFLVGDPKQAIYSFRSADLHVYLQARAQADALYTLAHNQRSSRTLLAAQNAVLSAQPRPFLHEDLPALPVQFGSKPRGVLVDRSGDDTPAAWQVWWLPDGDDGQPLPKAQALSRALQACAAEIARLLRAAQAGEVTLDGAPLTGGDVAVLVRTHRQGAQMARALAALGVASVELSQAHLHRSPDALELEQVLQAIATPQREDRVRAALATALMGWTADRIDPLGPHDAEVLNVMQGLAELRTVWLAHGVAAMLRRWMNQFGVASRLLARADGDRRMTNLLHLIERLQQASVLHPTPPAQLRWLQRQRLDPDADDTAQLRLESDRQLVQIVTMHRAKGLEYPIVFCPTLFEGDGAGRSDGVPGVLRHDAHGQAWLDFSADAGDSAAKTELARERAAEHLRLAYVAVTRAVHRCVVVAGAYSTSRSTRESGRSALAWWAAGAAVDGDHWLGHGVPHDQARAAWQALADAHPGVLSLRALPVADTHPSRLAADRPVEVQALTPPARVPAGWRIGSFSSLMRGAPADDSAADHDQGWTAEADARTELSEAAPIPDDDILRFPRGPAAGVCLHTALERADFGDRDSWPAAIDAALQQLPADDRTDRPDLAAMVARMFDDLFHTELAPGLRLADVARTRRLVELEFNLPVPALEAATLERAIRRAGCGDRVPPFATLQGYLRGFVDLVFEHGGRYHVVDWKSNHLGDRPADYAPPALAETLQANGYGLQGLIYATALHRLLRLRRPDYDPAEHFGGVMFLFVRGVRPHWPAGSGVARWRPDAATLDELSAVLGGQRS